MTGDPRLTPDPARSKTHQAAEICVPFADLNRTPGGARDRQVLYGEPVSVLDVSGGHSYVQRTSDGYVGFIPTSAHRPPQAASHRVSTRATHVYSEPNIKSPERFALSHGSLVTVTGTLDQFTQTDAGFIPTPHLEPIQLNNNDPASTAEVFLGTPYLWGGNTSWGIDCSGLVQAALLACGVLCPGDSDLQADHFSRIERGDLKRGDLVFWKGHVAMILDQSRIIHANAFHMSVVIEALDGAIKRIGQNEFGAVTGYARP